MTSTQFAYVFVKLFFSKHGMLDSIVTDRGSLFTGNFWETSTKLLKTKRKLSTAFHPQADGQTERMNATLEEYLRFYVDFAQDDWVDWLPLAEYAWCNSPSPITKLSPFEANGQSIRQLQVSNISGYIFASREVSLWTQ